ncbi:MAG: hypothetical protein VX589_13635 [Myxococcota bacterium]|nr:hypothetical protein [Myxococcota bacterium]
MRSMHLFLASIFLFAACGSGQTSDGGQEGQLLDLNAPMAATGTTTGMNNAPVQPIAPGQQQSAESGQTSSTPDTSTTEAESDVPTPAVGQGRNDNGGTDNRGNDDAASAEATSSSGVAAAPLPTNCTWSGFETARDLGRATQDGLAYVALSSAMLPYHALQIATYNNFNGPRGPGSFSLDGVNYSDCGLCLTIELGCRNPQEPCDRSFYADAGAVDIEVLDGERFAGRFRNVVFREVTIAEETFESTPVPNGQTWCFGDYSFDVVLDGGLGDSGGGDAPVMGNDAPSAGGVVNPQQCDSPQLACIGEEIQDFSLTNCGTGMPTRMSDYFAGMQGGWFLLTAGWCPACAQFIPSVLEVMEDPRITGRIKTAFVLGDNNRQGPSDLDYCRRYARQQNIPLENMFFDHDGQYAYATMFSYIWPYLVNGGIGLPFNALFEADTKQYIYADRASPSDTINDALNRLLR